MANVVKTPTTRKRQHTHNAFSLNNTKGSDKDTIEELHNMIKSTLISNIDMGRDSKIDVVLSLFSVYSEGVVREYVVVTSVSPSR